MLKNKDFVIHHLKSLPLRDLEKHILFGLIVRWFDGYPIIIRKGFPEGGEAVKKEIEQEELSVNSFSCQYLLLINLYLARKIYYYGRDNQ